MVWNFARKNYDLPAAWYSWKFNGTSIFATKFIIAEFFFSKRSRVLVTLNVKTKIIIRERKKSEQIHVYYNNNT